LLLQSAHDKGDTNAKSL